jgi:hypothetical protein
LGRTFLGSFVCSRGEAEMIEIEGVERTQERFRGDEPDRGRYFA